MPILEYQCEKGHVSEVFVGTEGWRNEIICMKCVGDATAFNTNPTDPIPMAHRILSPTRTNFVHAGGRKP